VPDVRRPHFTTTHAQTLFEALRAAGLIPPDAVRVEIDAEVGEPAYVYYETAAT
jgi:hypothetical protein